MDLEKRAFLICSVRDCPPEEMARLNQYRYQLERQGYKVHFPPEDTNQNDSIGLSICSKNRNAILNSDEIHIMYNPNSEGSKFDLGMTFMAGKPLIVANPLITINDDFGLFIAKYSSNMTFSQYNSLFDHFTKRKQEISESDIIEYIWFENSPEFLFDFGMAFMAEKQIKLINKKNVQQTPNKSFQNVLLELTK